MRWFHWTVEEFEATANPKNCEIFHLELQDDNKYKLLTPLREKENHNIYKFKWASPSFFSLNL